MKLSADDRAKLERIRELYERIPKVRCKGLCHEVCGPIPMTLLEGRRLQMLTHQKPKTDQRGVCVYLRNNRCSAYDARPLMCRAWGVIHNLSCMHGCVPERWLGTVEFVEIQQEIERLGNGLLATTPEGLTDVGDSYQGIDFTKAGENEIEHFEQATHSLRALHGGRVIGVVRKKP